MKAKVYVLMYHNFDGEWEYQGVYGSRKQAEDVIARYPKCDQSEFDICEEELEIPGDVNSQKVEPVITQDEFVRQSGGICPACGGWDVEAIESFHDIGAGYALRPIKCVECLATWEEEYALRGFVSLEGY